jgi:hypothetical protein
MSIGKLVNVDELTKMLGRELNKAMTEAAEPLIQDALKKIEQKMRERMAQLLISFIQNDFVVERAGHEIRILVKQAAK